jgi:sec-independent protein translocase protein TatA
MGLGGLSFQHLLVIFLIVIVIFGTGKLKSIGGDLGNAIKGFRKAMDSNDDQKPSTTARRDNKQIESDGKPDADFSEQVEKEKEKQG